VEPQWEYYETKIGGSPAHIHVDLSLGGRFPVSRLPILGWVWLQLDDPDPAGHPQGIEYELIEQLALELDAFMGERHRARLVGRNAYLGRVEFYFYARTSKGFDTAVHVVMSRFGLLDYCYDHKPDADWSFFEEFLLPGIWELHCIRNRKMLELLRDQGDSLQTVRPLEHWFYLAQRSQAEDLWQMLASRSFQQISLREETEYPEQPWALKVARPDALEEAHLNELVREMLALSEACAGTYDGWECEAFPE